MTTTQKAIGPTFWGELNAAGLANLAFGWSTDGTLSFSEAVTPTQQAAIEAVYAAHDPSKGAFMAAAEAALAKSDVTIVRCAENQVPVPAAWATYRATLRSIANGSSTGPLPAEPAYPTGT